MDNGIDKKSRNGNKNKNGNKEKRIKNNENNSDEKSQSKKQTSSKNSNGKHDVLKGKKKTYHNTAADKSTIRAREDTGVVDLSEDSEASQPAKCQVKKKKKKSKPPGEKTVKQCFKYSIESGDEVAEVNINHNDIKSLERNVVACSTKKETSAEE